MENCYSQVIVFPSVLTYTVYVVMSLKHDTHTDTLTTGHRYLIVGVFPNIAASVVTMLVANYWCKS